MVPTGDGFDTAVLRQAAEDAEPSLEGSPYTLAVPPTASRADWRRILTGTPLSINEVAAAAFVPRRVQSRGGGLVFAEELPAWLGRELGRTILLTADAGEGKTTYLNFLAVHMSEHFVPLRWRLPEPYDHERLVRFHAAVRGRLPQQLLEELDPLDPPLLVLGDLDIGLDASTADLLASSFALRDSEPDASVVVLAGRPSQLKLLEHRLDAEVVGLAPLDQHEARELCTLLHQAHVALSASMTAGELTNRYPNLLDFLRWPEDAQVALLTESDTQMLVGLLQAVYGKRFYERLIEEYQRLSPRPADQTAYLHVCLATAAGASLPESLLIALAPGADLDDRSQHDPWILDTDGMHSARHGMIAQVVIEESGARVRLSECLEKWLQLFLADEEAAPTFEKILYQAGHWESTAPARSRQFRSELHQRVRTVLHRADGLAERLEELCGSDVHRVLRWTAILRAFVPFGTNDLKHAFLVEVNRRLLERARALSSASDTVLQQRIGYYLDKNDRDRSRIFGEERLEDTERRVRRWTRYMDEQWCGPDFYSDLFWEASTMAESLTVSSLVEQDEERLVGAYRASVISFERLRALIGEIAYDDPRNIRYTKLINRYIHHALPISARLQIFGDAWQVSERSGQPNYLLAMIYAELLTDTDGSSEPDERVSEARTVLRAVLDSAPDQTDTLLRLALLSRGSPRARAEASRYLANALDTELSELELAFAHHTSAIVEDEPDQAQTHLRMAIDTYASSATTRKGWEALGEYWEAACSELARLGATPASGCIGALRQARSKWGHAPSR